MDYYRSTTQAESKSAGVQSEWLYADPTTKCTPTLDSPQSTCSSLQQRPRDVRPWPASNLPSTTSFSSSSKSIDEVEKGLTIVHSTELDDPERQIASREKLDYITTLRTLPKPPRSDWHDHLRYGFWSTYRRLFAICFLANIALIIAAICRAVKSNSSFTYHSAATAAGANLVSAVFFRHEHAVNRLFDLALAIPKRTPLSIKRHVAKVAYSYGGLHSAAGSSAMLWYIFYTVLLVAEVKKAGRTDGYSYTLATTAIVSDVLLVTVVGLSHPVCRRKWHNIWENTHRWGGYSLVALVLAQVLLIAATTSQHGPDSYIIALIKTPTFWFLLIIIALLAYPWTRLRKVAVTCEKHSDHAIRVYIPLEHLTPGFQTCRGIRVTDNPWRETHAFATIGPSQPSNPTSTPSPHTNNPSILISKAGDWTTKTILHPPTHLYLKGAPTTGVARITSLFSPVLLLTTGSGIGPCLSFLNTHRTHPVRVLWSARSPVQTYGPGILRDVLRADPRAVVVDTQKTGKPHTLGLVWGLVREMGAQAVVVISNPKVTGEVVFELERRGVPAFGAVFDS
ncbi:hypothetical protein MBLNU230_g0594t1 [Neophaeotheca triangularis]